MCIFCFLLQASVFDDSQSKKTYEHFIDEKKTSPVYTCYTISNIYSNTALILSTLLNNKYLKEKKKKKCAKDTLILHRHYLHRPITYGK